MPRPWRTRQPHLSNPLTVLSTHARMILLTHMEHALDVLVEALHVRLVHGERLAHHAAGLVDGHAAQLALVRLPVLVKQQQQLLGARCVLKGRGKVCVKGVRMCAFKSSSRSSSNSSLRRCARVCVNGVAVHVLWRSGPVKQQQQRGWGPGRMGLCVSRARACVVARAWRGVG